MTGLRFGAWPWNAAPTTAIGRRPAMARMCDAGQTPYGRPCFAMVYVAITAVFSEAAPAAP